MNETPRTTVVCSDVLAWAETYDGPPFHAMLCDPPYEISFMGRKWDASGIAFKPETWKALAQHLLPGAFIMAFGGSRTAHRLAIALEDAGLILHPCIGWVQGASFPKATRIDSQLDGIYGKQSTRFNAAGDTKSCQRQNTSFRADYGYKYEPATPLAQTWAGHRYGLQAMKPALELIAVAQVPYRGRPVESITTHGSGALNIEAARLDGKRWPPNFALVHDSRCVRVGERQVKGSHPVQPSGGQRDQIYGPTGARTTYGEFSGCKPYDYTDATGHETIPAYECHPSCPVAALDQQAGVRKSGGGHKNPHTRVLHNYSGGPLGPHYAMGTGGDTGSASRFFHVSDWSLDVAEQLAEAAPAYYCAKASRRERDSGLEDLPLRELAEHEGRNIGLNSKNRVENGVITGPKADSSRARNPHPTVKPIALTKWLATLLLPPGADAPRRILVPFCGVASEVIGAMLAGWDDILGIEQDASYVEIASARLKYWASQRKP